MKPLFQGVKEAGSRGAGSGSADAPAFVSAFASGDVLPDLSHFQANALEWLGRNRAPAFCLMLTYVDEIRGINETQGHASGIEVLREASRIIQEALGSDCYAGNLVAGYLAVLAPVSQDFEPEMLGNRLTRALNVPVRVGTAEVPLTVSTGCATYPQDGQTLHDLFRRALMALSYARRRGGNRYRLYDKVMGERVARRWTMNSRLRGAMERDEFKVMYQPHIDPATGRIIGAEALMRWRDGEHGPRSPAEFVPLLEEASLIIPVGINVMRAACRTAQSWIQAGHHDMVMSVNLSPRQIESPRMVSDVSAILEETGLPAEHLILEITEGMLLRDVDKTRDTVAALTMLGVRLVLDDFGTGYAALSSLKYLPLWGIKLDRSFVMGLPGSAIDLNICEVVLDLARRLKLHVIAEGVETEEQARFLYERGAHALQGFHYSPAVVDERFSELLLTQPFAPAG